MRDDRYLRGGGVNQSIAATRVANPQKMDARNTVLLQDIAVGATHEVLSRARLTPVSPTTSAPPVPFGNICYDWHQKQRSHRQPAQIMKVNFLFPERSTHPHHNSHNGGQPSVGTVHDQDHLLFLIMSVSFYCRSESDYQCDREQRRTSFLP
jgi:hypothetical protein